MSIPRSSNSPHFLKDTSLDLNTQLLPVITTVTLAIVAAITYAIVSNKSKYPLANPPKWFETRLSKQLEFAKNGRKIIEEARKRYGNKPYRLLMDIGEYIVIPANRTDIIRTEKELSFGHAIGQVSSTLAL